MSAPTTDRNVDWLLSADAPELLSKQQVLEVLGRNKVLVEQLLFEGTLPGVRIGSRTYIPRQCVLRLLALPSAETTRD